MKSNQNATSTRDAKKQESSGKSSASAGGGGADSQSSTTHMEAGKDVAKEAGAKAAKVKDKVVDEAAQARDDLQDRAGGFFKDVRGAVADQIERLTEALRGSEQEMKDQGLDEIAKYPTMVADHIDDVNEYLRERSGRGMRRDFERIVAEQPVAVIGGLAAVGALMTWYFRSDRSSNGSTSQSSNDRKEARRKARDEAGGKQGGGSESSSRDSSSGGESSGRA